jgi:site-specific recombinase XerD
MKVGPEQVKLLVDHARAPRDRAIILALFQGGMDVSTLCSLKYGDAAEGISKNELPLRLELYRPKTGTEYYTFLGEDAIGALKAYIADARARGIQFKNDSPLFMKEREEKPWGMLFSIFSEAETANHLRGYALHMLRTRRYCF